MKVRTGTPIGAITMALVWALIWAAPGGVIEAIDNLAPNAHSFTRQTDMWPQTLGLPGLIGGALFSVLLLITGGRRSIAELPLIRSGAWGAVSGLLVGAIVVWVVARGLSEPWQLAWGLVGLATVLGAVSGVGSPLLLRYAARKRASAIS